LARPEIGCRPVPPSEADYAAATVVASGQRGGDLVPVGTNLTYAFNREMGEAMEAWNAHRWSEAAGKLRRIYEQHPDSPWAAEAELHVACYCKFNGLYDEAEERFLSILTEYSQNVGIQKKVLHYLPHLYAATGRLRAAQDMINLLRQMPLNWQERQFCENWGRAYHAAVLADDSERLCGTKAAALAVESHARGRHEHEPLLNRSLDGIYRTYGWARERSANDQGYSLQDLARLTGGTPREIGYDDLRRLATPRTPVLVFLETPAEPKVYERLGWVRPAGYRRPWGPLGTHLHITHCRGIRAGPRRRGGVTHQRRGVNRAEKGQTR